MSKSNPINKHCLNINLVLNHSTVLQDFYNLQYNILLYILHAKVD